MMRIKKVAVLGSGVMGSGIACQLANVGLEVLMLDILPKDAGEGENRNIVAESALQKAIKSKPAPLYDKAFVSRIETGNFEDDFARIRDYDWIIEVVVERLDIKRQILEKVDKHRSKASIITSNTSGIPIHMIAAGRSEDFRKHFFGSHFFNPPRYLRLLELIPTEDTDRQVLKAFAAFGDKVIGKETVLCKDTPAFIANRVGVFAMAYIFQLADRLGLTINEVDKLTGPALARPKTGTFRLSDLVGLDVAVKVIKGIQENAPEDEMFAGIEITPAIAHLLEHNWLGNKSGQGFYMKTEDRDEKGKRIIKSLDLQSLEYGIPQKSALQSLKLSRQIDDDKRRIQTLFDQEDKGGQLIRESLLALFAYVSHRIPEIADHIYEIDNAVRAGFNWTYGPFEYWDIIGVRKGLEEARKAGFSVAVWVDNMLAAGNEQFYRVQDGVRSSYNPESGSYQKTLNADAYILLDDYRNRKPVYKNDEVILHDIGDQVLCLEFRSKMNAIGEGILRGLNESIEIAERGDWRGLVIGNNAEHFTVGANLMLVGMMAFQQQYMELEMAVKLFQDTSMRCRYSNVPVVSATQGYVFGGGCEISMHCDAVASAAESYIGLVEVGVGILPGGAGTKEFAVRLSDDFHKGGVDIPLLIERFRTIAMGKVATSAYEAFNYGYLSHAKDEVVHNLKRNIARAKALVIDLSESYVAPSRRSDIRVLGRTGLGALYVAANELKMGNWASEHDIKIARKIAYVLCGGDLSGPQEVTEQYLLDLEREAFMSLCMEPKSLERIQHMLEHNKPLRN